MVFADVSLTLDRNKFRVAAYQNNDCAKKKDSVLDRSMGIWFNIILIWTKCEMYRGNNISYLVLNVLKIATICSSQFLKDASAFFNNALILKRLKHFYFTKMCRSKPLCQQGIWIVIVIQS